MKVLMLKSRRSFAGKPLEAGSAHDLPDGEAQAFIRQGAAAAADQTRSSRPKPTTKDVTDDAGGE